MSKITLFILLLITNLSCSQKSNNQKMEDFNLNTLYKKITIYNEKPEYWLFLHSSNCSYVVTLDDMPIYTDYNEGSMKSLSIPINNFILESKKNELKVLILPKRDENYHLDSILDSSFSLDVKVSRTENKKETIVFNKKISGGEQKESFRQIFIPFESNVPYKLTGWTNSIDLTKEDKEVLGREVESFYREMMNDYKDGKIENIEKKYYKRQFENAQSFYSSKKEDSDRIVSEINKDINKEQDLKLEDYKLVFYGNGKVVGLVRTDGEFLGKSAFLGLTDEDFYIYSLLLHRPKTGSSLEVIR
ncbi:hypothetical protein QQY79_21565 [Flavobacterium tructae]|uniref:hypothetical protein n=1 Tax=Flavobacterium TaxID=237 RepID=UPI00222507C8|nr:MULTISPECIES: hypothetical protein [Flavobacterium]MDL2145122.1 hypothetical protein [Flavobacterium tructae]